MNCFPTLISYGGGRGFPIRPDFFIIHKKVFLSTSAKPTAITYHCFQVPFSCILTNLSAYMSNSERIIRITWSSSCAPFSKYFYLDSGITLSICLMMSTSRSNADFIGAVVGQFPPNAPIYPICWSMI